MKSDRVTMALMLVLVAVLYLQTGALGEPQGPEDTDRTPPPSPALLLYLQKLKDSRVDMLENYRSSPREFLNLKSEDTEESTDDSHVPHSRVKRYKQGSGHHLSRHGSWGCPLATCQTQNLANWLYLLAVNKGKDDTAPLNTGDPHSYGKRRRRRRSLLPPGRADSLPARAPARGQ
uniref:pro-adrenomedullin-like isoform X2 n=1 Tax=Pristiophorus japonicus TaxID=55135 RepID=UPI00398E79BD